MKAVYKHIAVKPLGGLLETEILARLYLALIANVVEFPFVYTPIKFTSCTTKSGFSPDALNHQWEEFFRQVTDEFMHIDSLDEEALLLDADFSVCNRLFSYEGNYFLSDRLFLSHFAKQTLAKVGVFSSKLDQSIPKEAVRKFMKKSYCTYVKTFASGTRTSFENNTLQASFVIHEDGGLRAPFVFDRLVPVLDFVEEYARSAGHNLQLHLLTSLEFDQAVPDCWVAHKMSALEAACSRSYVHPHQSLSFKEIMNMLVGADLTWIGDTFYGRDILRPVLMLISRPEQVLVEVLPTPKLFRLNQCFLAWEGKRSFWEKRQMPGMLGVAGRDPAFFRKCGKRILSAKKRLKKRRFNIATNVVDGAGSCFLKIFVMQLIADYYGLRYIHLSRIAIDHNYTAASDWERMWERFFMPGEGRPRLNEVFSNELLDVLYCYMLPTLSELKSLDLPPDALVVSGMAQFEKWPVPDDYLSRKVLQARTFFHERHRHREDSFDTDVINVVVHIRAVDDYLPSVKKIFRKNARIGAQGDLSAYAARTRVFYNTMQQLGMPFQLHVYSDAHRRDLEPLLEFGDVRLHLSEDKGDWRLHCLEMSRADVFLPSYSRISYAAAVLAQPNQLQLVTNHPEGDLLRLLICGGNTFYREHTSILQDVKLVEKFLDRRT